MQQTLKHVAIFVLFLVGLLFWNAVRDFGADYFDFRYGETALLLLWSTCVVILFHLLFHYFSKVSDRVTYTATVAALLLAGGLVYTDHLGLPGA